MHETLLGLNVVDDAAYSRYRAEMTPILEAHGGSFGVDVRVSEVLRPADKAFNRLFTIVFPSREKRDAFFSNPAYVEVRNRWFEPSVTEVHRLAVHGE